MIPCGLYQAIFVTKEQRNLKLKVQNACVGCNWFEGERLTEKIGHVPPQ